ncbi:MAG: HAMP domain-containing methyl-accepting chemotaxis protein [Selenomonadaceae bacterium]|nr:HAMP domain-containing methyl-accepting chemotaxis protein [Selenomonadaceae bacterium]
MQWMNNMSTPSKLLLLNIISLIGMIVIGFVGYNAISEAKKDLHVITNVYLEGIFETGRCRHAMRYAQVQGALTPMTDNESLIQDRRSKYQNAAKEVEDAFDKFEVIVADYPQTRAKANEAENTWNKFKTNMDKLIEMRSPAGADAATVAAHRESAMKFYEDNCIAPAVDLGNALLEIQMSNHQDAEATVAKTNEILESQGYNLIIVIIITFIIMTVISTMMSKAITTPLSNTVEVLHQLKGGDFRRNDLLDAERGDEFGSMGMAVREMRQSIGKLIHQTSDSSNQFAASSQELTASAHQSAQASEQVAQSVTNSAGAVIEQQGYVNDAMESINRALVSIEKLAKTADMVATHVSNATEEATNGSQAVETAVSQIFSVEKIVNNSAATVDKLGKRSQEIGQIVEAISGIAEQTNLLALNAAIEAARAGEHGRGFAVVSEEVRKLAEESQEAAQKIATLIGDIQSDTTEAVDSMQQGNAAVRDGTRSVERLRATFDSIRTANNNVQTEATNMVAELQEVEKATNTIRDRSEKILEKGTQVSREMESVSAAAQQQSASAEEISSAADELARLAQDLQNSLQRFQY